MSDIRRIARVAAVFVLAIPYAIVAWPLWAARDLAIAVRDGYRKSKTYRLRGGR